MSVPSLILDGEASPPSARQIFAGVVRRLLLPLLAIILVFWNSLVLMVSFRLVPDNDFSRIYYSTRAFLDSEDMYGATVATPARIQDHTIQLYNLNPPHLHLAVLPFTWLEDSAALVAWWITGGFCLWLSFRWTLAELKLTLSPSQRSWALVFFLAFAPTSDMLFTGQVSFVMLPLMTLAWLAARRGCWGRSGALLGVAISVKPFLAIFLAYYVWRRHGRALGAGVMSATAVFAVGLLIFGWDNYASWRSTLGMASAWGWLPTNAAIMGAFIRMGTKSISFEPVAQMAPNALWLAWLIIGGIMGIVTVRATSRGKHPVQIDRDTCLLLLAAVLLSPLGWIYYLWFAVPSFIALLHAGWLKPYPENSAGEPARWRRPVAFACLSALLFPTMMYVDLFQPSALSTVLLGNMFFWGLIGLWWLLVVEGLREPAVQLELPPLPVADFRISVVVPVYSETDTVRQITHWVVDNLGPSLEEILIVQSPRSSAESRAVCRQLADELPRVRLHMQEQNPGLGNAVREAYARVRGNLVLNIDADGEMEIETVPRMLAEMVQGNHGMVVASRWLKGGGFSGYNGPKYYLNWCFQQLFRWLFWTRLHDLTYGFKLLRAELVQGIRWHGTLHEIACETTLKPVRIGVSVAEVPSKWTARTQGVSKNTFWRNFRYVRMALGILMSTESGLLHRSPATPTARAADLVSHAPACALNAEVLVS